jgi:hypothetical protein
VSFIDRKLTLDQILPQLSVLEELTCDENCEEYVLKERTNKNFLPKLKLLNGLPLSITDKEERANLKKVREVVNKL